MRGILFVFFRDRLDRPTFVVLILFILGTITLPSPPPPRVLLSQFTTANKRPLRRRIVGFYGCRVFVYQLGSPGGRSSGVKGEEEEEEGLMVARMAWFD